MSDSIQKNIRLIEEQENKGKRYCPECGHRMKTCCDLYRQLNLPGHRPNGVHKGPEEWICLSCGLIEYKELALRVMCGRAGNL